MARRFYLSEIVEAVFPDLGPGTQPRLIELALDQGFSIQCGGIDGRTNAEEAANLAAGWMASWAIVSDAAHEVLRQDPGIVWIPFENSQGDLLDAEDLIGEVDPARRIQIRNALEARHIPTDDLTLTDPIKKVIARIVRRIQIRRKLGDADWVEGLDTLVSEIPLARRQVISERLANAGYDPGVIQGTDTIREALQKLQSQDVEANWSFWDR